MQRAIAAVLPRDPEATRIRRRCDITACGITAAMNEAFRWNDWNRDHIAAHGVLPEEAEYVVNHASAPYPEMVGQGKWRVRGRTLAGRFLQVIFVIEAVGTS